MHTQVFRSFRYNRFEKNGEPRGSVLFFVWQDGTAIEFRFAERFSKRRRQV